MGSGSVNPKAQALHFDRGMQSGQVPRTWPVVFGPDESVRLLAAAPCIEHRAARTVTYVTGLRDNESSSLAVGNPCCIP